MEPLNKLPSIKKKNIGYRTVTDSAQINDLQNEAVSDIYCLFNRANNLEKILNETKDIINIENKYLLLRLKDMENKLAVITDKYLNLSSTDKIKTLNLYPDDCYIEESSSPAFIDLENMDITLNMNSSTSKLNIYDDNFKTSIVPESLKVEVYPIADNRSIFDNSVINAFKKESNSYWIRKVITDNSVSEVNCTMTITLPYSTMILPTLNTIIIKPYPSDSVDITNVEYSLDGDFITLPAFQNYNRDLNLQCSTVFGDSHDTNALNEVPSVKFNFKELNATKIRISFKQKHYVNSENGGRIFYIGAKNIEVLNCKYTDDYSIFYSKADFSVETGSIQLNDINLVLNNCNEVNNNQFETSLYYVDDNNISHIINDKLPCTIPTKQILIKSKLYNGDIVPDVNRIAIKYSVL
ncbi:hypothetical protein [Clostridium felsineum]|uniref:Uncharacterized protein n=1 Tax=Clostridium felsineum TaxID=36839 RepID=A0A1S8MF02_9CLOT|nr:hypothetical protein [Clostridium felsineum]URZ09219.1 hypothetical protein CLROS_046350 [Clostridium felsineum]URZ13905.1 hypothetical protein CROST_046830 [Clostridium felsineum]